MKFSIAIIISFYITCIYCSTSCDEYAQQGDTAIESFLDKFWSSEEDYLDDSWYPGKESNQVTGYWTYAQGFDALLDAAERNATWKPWIGTLYAAQETIGWDRPYYDDMNWMALALLRASQLSNNPQVYMKPAIYLFNQIYNGWDETCCGSVKGGIWWDTAHTSKATASNGGPAILGAKLYMLTKNETYLNFAEKVFAFWWANMVDQTTYQICDHIATDGTKTWWKFTYNEGLMIGAATALYEATGNKEYLVNGSLVVHFMLTNEVNQTEYGLVLTDGPSCGGDCIEFKGPAIRYLTSYYLASKDQVVYQVLQSCADSVWNLARNPTTNGFSISWSGPAPAYSDVISEQQANTPVMALNLFATACKSE